jgi:hypothetical protein
MNRGTEPSLAKTGEQMPPLAGSDLGGRQELDLDRLVWDPEYRNAMLPLIKPGR